MQLALFGALWITATGVTVGPALNFFTSFAQLVATCSASHSYGDQKCNAARRSAGSHDVTEYDYNLLWFFIFTIIFFVTKCGKGHLSSWYLCSLFSYFFFYFSVSKQFWVNFLVTFLLSQIPSLTIHGLWMWLPWLCFHFNNERCR